MTVLNLLDTTINKNNENINSFLNTIEPKLLVSTNDLKISKLYFINNKKEIIENITINDDEKNVLCNVLEININFICENNKIYKIKRTSDFTLVILYEIININFEDLLNISEDKNQNFEEIILNNELKKEKNYNNLLIDFINKIEPKLKSVLYSYNTLKIIKLFKENIEERNIYNKFIFEYVSNNTNKNLENMSSLLYELRNYFNNEVKLFVENIIKENTNKDFYEIMVLPSTMEKLSKSNEETIVKELNSNINLLKVFIENTDIKNKQNCLEFTKLVEDVRHFFHQTINIITMLSLKLLNKVISKEIEKNSIIKDNLFFLDMFESVIIRILKFEKQLQELKLISQNKDDIVLNERCITITDIIKYFKLVDNKKEFLYKEKINEINLKFNVENYNLIIKIDYEKILEAIETLLQNAYEELSEKEIELENNYEKNVEINIYTDDTNLYITVKDNGRGVSEENKKRIFDKYFTTGKRDGSGIGLAAVAKIMDLLKGEIELKTKINEGSEFILKLPKN